MLADVRALLAVAALGVLGWVLVVLLLAAACGAERTERPCAVYESADRVYLSCDLGVSGAE